MAAQINAFNFHYPNQRRAILLMVAVFLGLHLLWIIYGVPTENAQFLIGNLTLIFTGCAATLLAYETRRQLVQSGSAQPAQIAVWGWLCAGMALWTINDAARMAFEKLTINSLTMLTIVDVLHFSGIVALSIGLFHMPRQPRKNIGALRLLLDMTITSVAIITIAWSSIFQPVYPLNTGGIGTSSAIIYPVLDLLLLLALVNLFLISRPGSLPPSYTWISFAAIIFSVSDLLYSYRLVHGEYQVVSLISFGWALGDGMIIMAAIAQFQMANAQVPAKNLPWLIRRGRNSLQSLLPLVITILMGLYTIVNWQFDNQLDPLGLWVTAVLGLGLIARQGIAAGEVEYQQYATLVNGVAEPTFVCDRRGRLRLANPAFLTTWGAGENERYYDQPINHMIALSQPLDAVLANALANGWSGEAQLRRMDGTQIPVSLSLRPISSGNDFSLALAGTAHDLTEYKRQQETIQQAYEQVDRAREALEQLNAQLEQKVVDKTASLSEAYEQLEEQNRKLQTLDQMKSDFVSMVSHELRAPLTNINGGIELVLTQPSTFPPRARSTLDLVQGEVQRLTRFVETILDLSALEAGRTPIVPAPVHLDTIIIRLKNQMRHLADAERVRWQIPIDLPFFMADEQALLSILFHLVDNAMKYAPTGDIVVSAGSQTTRAWVQVTDEGPGIQKEDMPFLFSRFYRSRPSDSQTVYGHGLGLYIVHRLIQAMQGEIQVMNRPQGGACFTCWLPILTQVDQAAFESDDLMPESFGDFSPIDQTDRQDQ